MEKMLSSRLANYEHSFHSHRWLIGHSKIMENGGCFFFL